MGRQAGPLQHAAHHPTRSGPENCTGERLTAIFSRSGQVAAWRQASVRDHSPMAWIRPHSSAIEMNSEGGTLPRSGWRQRASASNPAISPVFRTTEGW